MPSDGAGRCPTMDAQALEAELVRRNREIAKLREQFQRSQSDIDEWKSRNDELVSRLSEFDTELNNAGGRVKASEERAQKAEAELKVRGAGGDVQTALARCLVLEQTNAKLEGRMDEFRFQEEQLKRQVEEERQRTKVFQDQVLAVRADADQRSSATQEEAEQLRRRARSAETNLQDVQAKQSAEARLLAATSGRIAELERCIAQEQQKADAGDKLRGTLVLEIEELQRERNSVREESSNLRSAVAAAENRLEEKRRELLEAQDACRKTSAATAGSEDRLRQQVLDASARIAELERELSGRPAQDVAAQADVKARILQSENQKLKTEAQLLKRQCHEAHEGSVMGQEELRTRTIETQHEIVRLRMQLEETRRARSLEMRALISKMCTAPQPQSSHARASMGTNPRRPSPGPGSIDATAHF